MMNKLSGLIFGIAMASIAPCQAPDFGGKKQIEMMGKLSFLAGEWEGSASFFRGEQKIAVLSSEKVEIKAGGAALFVTGMHYMMRGDQKVLVHDAAAMIFWDEKLNSHRMMSQLGNGARSEFSVTVEGKGFKWQAPSPAGGTMRYVMTMSPSGEWLETGEQSNDGKVWTKSFEMRLNKKASK